MASLNVNSKVFTQGVRNLNDGLSAVNIAEGAMEELGNIIIRIEELASQSSSETYSDTQRQSLQKEAAALTAEWNRIVESTSFNGQSLLTGSNTRTVLQGGKGVEATLAVQVGEAQLANGLEGYGGTGTTRISTNSAGNQSVGGTSYGTAISDDGRYIAFHSAATNLVAGDTNGLTDSFVKDTVTGATTRISTDSAGNQAVGGNSYVTAISADGRYVAFNSGAANLVSGDSNGSIDSFVKDLHTGAITRVSVGEDGHQPLGDTYVNAISSEGRYVILMTNATSLLASDTNATFDVFKKDTYTGQVQLVSSSSQNIQANNFSRAIDVSADGRYVAFWSNGTNLVEGDTNGQIDSFVKDTVTGVVTRVSTDSQGGQGNGASYVSTISADGRTVAFHSSATNLVSGDTNGETDSFIKDIHTGITSRVSTSSSGAEALGGNSVVTGLSADGRYALFWSNATNLVLGDSNGLGDSFIKDTLRGTTTLISVATDGSQGISSYSRSTALSADGRYAVFFSSATNLVSGDTNAQQDVFLRDLTKTGVQTLAGVVVSNKASAKITLDLAQRYRAELLDYRSKLGATTSRISTFVNTLQASTINYKAASSRITDADIAAEAAKSVAAGIRQQVAASLLGQANQAPQIALSLLQNA